MKKKVLILFRGHIDKYDNIVSILRGKLGESVQLDAAFSYKDLRLEFLKDQETPQLWISDQLLDNYSQVVMYTVKSKNKNLSSLIAHYCKAKRIPWMNQRELYHYDGGKILQKLLLSLANIPVPKFYYCADLDKCNYQEIIGKLGNPFVIKESIARLGEGVHLISSENEYLNTINRLKTTEINIFFEEYIPHEYTTRCFITGNDCQVNIKVSKEANSFRTNRGKADFSQDMDELLAKMSINASKVMKLDIAGVDTVFDTRDNKHKVFEVNQSPGITIEPFISPEIDAIAYLIKENVI